MFFYLRCFLKEFLNAFFDTQI
jgi:hypothetical protein